MHGFFVCLLAASCSRAGATAVGDREVPLAALTDGNRAGFALSGPWEGRRVSDSLSKTTPDIRRRDTVPDVLFEVSFRRKPPERALSAKDSIRWEKIRARQAHRDTSVDKDNFWRKMLGGDVDRTYSRKFDFSAAAVPRYSYEGGIGIGGILAGNYRLDKSDSTLLPSDVALEGSVEWRGFFYAGISGNTYFPGHKHRFSYDVYFEQQNTDFWGISYEACAMNPVSSFRRWNVLGNFYYDYRFAPGFYIGAALESAYSLAKEGSIENPGYFEGQAPWYYTTGFGLSLQYDSRDFPLYPYQGWNIVLRPMVYPAFAGTCGRTLWQIVLQADYFQWLWRGGVLAFDFYARNGSSRLPWSLKQMAGGENRLRGYYLGRYSDDNLFSFQVELRQKLFWRIGLVAFGGLGAVYPSFSGLRAGMLLPSYGLGLRFEFKKGLNVRVDYALGKDSWKPGSGNRGVFVLVMGESF